MGSEPIEDYSKIAMLVSLKNMIQHDKSILKISDLPKGFQATRKNKSDKWEIKKIEYSDEEIKEFGFYCSDCGQYHKDVPMAYGTDAPLLYFLIPEDQRKDRCEINDDQCIIDGKHFFLRGTLEIPVENNEEDFLWNVWVEISESDFDKINENWEDENRILDPPYKGEIATQLEPYPQTCGLSVLLVTQKVGLAPKVVVLETNHPLFFEQQSGIDMTRVTDFAIKILYKH